MSDDYAILVGIGKYADVTTFPELYGPLNDVVIMKEWLISTDGGNVRPENIITIISPKVIDLEDPDSAPPMAEDFHKAFKKLVRDKQGHFITRPGRLYLYFSGHGFCEKKILTPQAALYTANATREFPENIFGSCYALLAQDKALFLEIVLIMDCCRDAEVNRPMSIPTVNEAGNGAAIDVKIFCIYAAPKGGKAQERKIAERGNNVHGLLTHAVLKAFSEAVPDVGEFITCTALKRHLLETWNALCEGLPAPAPEFVLPTGVDLQFRSRNQRIKQGFEFSEIPANSTEMKVFDTREQLVVKCDLQPQTNTSTATWNGSQPVNLDFDGKFFSLGLQPNYYKYVLSGGLSRSELFAVRAGGEAYVRL